MSRLVVREYPRGISERGSCSREQREAEKKRKLALREEKRREKHRGH